MADKRVEKQKLYATNKAKKAAKMQAAHETNQQREDRKVAAQTSSANPQYEQIMQSLTTQSGRKRFIDRLNKHRADGNQNLVKEYENIMQEFFKRYYGNKPDPLAAFKNSGVSDMTRYLDSIPGYNNNDYEIMNSLQQDALTSIYHTTPNGLTIDNDGNIVPNSKYTYYDKGIVGNNNNIHSYGNEKYSPGEMLYGLLNDRYSVFTTTPKDTENKFRDDTHKSLMNLAGVNEYTVGNNRFAPSDDPDVKEENNKYIKDLAVKYADAVTTALRYKGVYDDTLAKFKGMDENKIKQLYPSEAWKIDNYNSVTSESNRVISIIERELNSLVSAGHKRAYNSFLIHYADIVLNSPYTRYLGQSDVDTIANNARTAKEYNGATSSEVLNTAARNAESGAKEALNQEVR